MEENNNIEQIVEKEEQQPIIVKEEKPKKSSIFHTITNIIAWLFVLFVLVTVIISCINFGKIQKNEEPYFLVKEEKYEEEGNSYEVYHFGLYKVVKQSNETNYSYYIKLWFMDDAR